MARRPSRAKRADAAPLTRRTDGWANVFTGHGTARDKRLGTAPQVLTLDWKTCESLYRGDWTAAKIADEPAREMTRKWIDVLVQDDSEAQEEAEKYLAKRLAASRFQEAIAKSRAYGGAGIVLGIEDGRQPWRPVNRAAIQSIRFLTVYDSVELYPRTWYSDPFADGAYGTPETYWLQPQGLGTAPAPGPVTVHESRLLRFEGVRVSRRQALWNRGWGDSAFVRVFEVLSDFGIAWGSAGHLLQDFAQAVLKIRGLADLIANGQEAQVRARLEAIELGRSVVRAAVLDAGDGETGDAGESFERKATPVTGMPELLDRFCTLLAAACDMPLSRLFGTTPGGFAKGDDSGERWWTERIEGLQREVMQPALERLLEYVFLAKDGPTKGAIPENWSLQFKPLRQLDPIQEADRRLKVAQADHIYVTDGVVAPEEVGTSRFGGDAYSSETQLMTELRDKMGALEAPEPPPVPVGPGGKPLPAAPKPAAAGGATP